jgi:GntR family transcriptional regulator/MocR family aminotransferase
MAKRAVGPIITGLRLDRSAPLPLYRQIYEGLRAAILQRRLAPGARLPSTRTVARDLGISRYTVVEAFLQLLSEGYIEGKAGSGTYVTRTLPEELLHSSRPRRTAPAPLPASRLPSQRSTVQRTLGWHLVVSRWARQDSDLAFQVGVPALEAFPGALWGRLVARYGRNMSARRLGYLDPAGYQPLREAIAAYLSMARGVTCTAEQVIVVSGAQQGIGLSAQALLNPGDTVWVEEPGYFGAKGALLGAGARLVPVPVDPEGVDVGVGQALCPTARLACVTPSHQFPLGVTMSLSRRLALLAWARQADAWILEDDYDSEYRYVGKPLTALQGLDTTGRVIYVGTFSKVLFPALRLGYVVVPSDLIEAFLATRLFMDMHPPWVEQLVLAEFMAAGHFARHIRRMRTLYAERQAALVEAARPLAGRLEVGPAEAGMHLVGWLPPGSDDQALAQFLARFQVSARPLSRFCLEPTPQRALLLGYAAVPIPAIQEGVRRLVTALAQAPTVTA